MKNIFIKSFILVNFFLVLPDELFAATPLKKVLRLDYNGDKKIDLIETYQNNLLVKKEQDLDYDGTFDETREYFPYTSEKEAIEVITKKDRVARVYRHEKLQLFITTTDIDSNGDGVFDKTITDHKSILQKTNATCDPLASSFLNSATALEADITKAMRKLNDGYVETETGYRIHQSCMDNWGAQNFTKVLSKSMTQGLSCLNTLAEQNTKNNPQAPNGALNNLMGVKRLLDKPGVTILCHEKTYRWGRAVGHASTSTSDKISTLKVAHPYISLSPEDPKNKMNPDQTEVSEITKTLFHEQLHNLGIRHGEGIEYPYSCETCCLPSPNDSQPAVASACKICAGQYDLDKEGKKAYLRDVVSWGEQVYNQMEALKAITNYQKEYPNDQWAITLYARSNSGVFSPVGIEMAKLLKNKFPVMGDEEKNNLNQALFYQHDADLTSVAPQAKVIAEAQLKLYYENDVSQTLTSLESKKETLKGIVADANKSSISNNVKYINQDLFQNTKKILVDIWLRNYPKNVDSAASTKAYNLLIETGLLD